MTASCPRQRDPRVALYFPTLDGLRFVAFLLVFVHHLPRIDAPIMGFLHDNGWVGVHIFLLLSAYLLTKILVREQNTAGEISLKRFYIRRGLRIWPLYYAFCGGAAAYTAIAVGWRPYDSLRLGALAVFLDNVASGCWGYSPIKFVPHLWTISLEEQFYLVLPWLLRRMLRRSHLAIAGALGIAWFAFILARIAIVAWGGRHPLIWTSVFSADSLLLGTYLGARGITIRGAVFQFVAVIAALPLLFFVGLMPEISQQGMHQVLIYSVVAVGAGLLCLVAVDAPWLEAILGGRAMRYLGKISYGLYVFHMLGIWSARQIVVDRSGASWTPMAATALLLTVAMSIASYELFEKHFLRLKHRFEVVHTRPA